MSKRIRTILQYTFFLALGMFLAWWSLRDLSGDNKSHIREALKTARYWLIVPVFVILFLSHYIRAIRWKLLMEPLGYKPSTTNTVFAVFIGYMANQAFPRLGEVLKCTVLAKYENIPADKLIGTIILERVIDAITLLIVFGITIAIQPTIYGQLMDTIFDPIATGSKEGGNAKSNLSSIVLLVIIGVLVIVLLTWMIRKKKKLSDLGLLFKQIGRSIWQGVSAIRHLKRRGLFIFLTVSMWSLYLAGGYIGFMALKETQQYGINEAFTVLSAGSIGMVATPGGIGSYAILVQKTMQVYGLNGGIALAFGWILWVAQFAVIVVGGLISFVAIPYYNKNKKG
jgi:glycosyltransferase 2 family protein